MRIKIRIEEYRDEYAKNNIRNYYRLSEIDIPNSISVNGVNDTS